MYSLAVSKNLMNGRTMSNQGGFTLIELIAVVVILGILAATAMPKFMDLSGEAEMASVKGMASSIEGSSNLNYAVNMAVDAGISSDTVSDTAGVTCAVAAKNLLATEIDPAFSITGASITSADEGTVNPCQLNRGKASFDFSVISAEP